VADLKALDRYRFCGHCTLIGKFREECTTFKALRGIGKKIKNYEHILRDAGLIERVLGASNERLEG
jgi:hypothetical protein